MSLQPFTFRHHPLFRSSWWDVDIKSPSQIFDQFFAVGLRDEDLFPLQQGIHGAYVRPRRALNRSASGMSQVSNDEDRFQVMLQVGQFAPEELSVKTVDDSIVVRGRHEERSDEHGFVSREFVRRFVLPPGTKPEDVTSELASDGVLKIVAPKRAIEAPPTNERQVVIQRAPAPAVLEAKVAA